MQMARSVDVTLIAQHFSTQRIHLTVVERAARGSGVGTAMLRAIEADAISRGAPPGCENVRPFSCGHRVCAYPTLLREVLDSALGGDGSLGKGNAMSDYGAADRPGMSRTQGVGWL